MGAPSAMHPRVPGTAGTRSARRQKIKSEAFSLAADAVRRLLDPRREAIVGEFFVIKAHLFHGFCMVLCWHAQHERLMLLT